MVAQKTYKRECKQCGKEFEATHHAVRICSDDCRKAKDSAKSKAYKKSPKGIAKRKALEADPDYQARRRERLKVWKNLPEVKAQQKAYRDSPKRKEIRKAYDSTAKVKARMKAYNAKRYITSPGWEIKKNMPHTLYLIEFTQGNRTYLKVGLTGNAIEFRFSDDIRYSRMSNFKIVDSVTFSNHEACKVAEAMIHDETLNLHVKPVIGFNGSSRECRLPSALPKLLSMFESAKAGLEAC